MFQNISIKFDTVCSSQFSCHTPTHLSGFNLNLHPRLQRREGREILVTTAFSTPTFEALQLTTFYSGSGEVGGGGGGGGGGLEPPLASPAGSTHTEGDGGDVEAGKAHDNIGLECSQVKMNVCD